MRASPLLLVLAACSSVPSDDSSLSAYDTATDLTGVVIQGKTHFHTIYRDKATDYGGSL